MGTTTLTDDFIVKYLNYISFNDLSLLLNRTDQVQKYIDVSKEGYFTNDVVEIHRVVGERCDSVRNKFIKTIMNKYPGPTTIIFEDDFLGKIDYEKCVSFINASVVLKVIDKNLLILSSILTNPTDAQKPIIDRNKQLILKKHIKDNPKIVIDQLLDNKAFSSDLAGHIYAEIHPSPATIKDEIKHQFVIVSKEELGDSIKQDENKDQTLYKIIEKEVEKETKRKEESWNKLSMEELVTVFNKIMIKYNHYEKNTMTSRLVCDKLKSGIISTALQHYCLRRRWKEEKLEKEKDGWDTMSLDELKATQCSTLCNWRDKGGQPASDQETDLKLLRMSQYIGHRRIEERYSLYPHIVKV